jgi:hypothetical protein
MEELTEILKSLAYTTERLSFLAEELFKMTIDIQNKEYYEKEIKNAAPAVTKRKG